MRHRVRTYRKSQAAVADPTGTITLVAATALLALLVFLCGHAVAAEQQAQSKYTVVGPMKSTEVKKVISANKTALSRCYNEALAKTPGWGGTVTMRWSIDSNGRVAQVRATAKSGNRPLEKCLSRAISRWRFTEPLRDEPVLVSYPFVFAASTQLYDYRTARR